MQTRKIYTAGKIFTGDTWLSQFAIIVQDGMIEAVVPENEVPGDMPKIDFANGIIVPAYMDIQIYGAYGKLFSVYPEPDTLFKMHAYCCKGGAYYFQPTLATNSYAVFKQGIEAVKTYWAQGGAGVTGLHLEGPWINPLKRGAHKEVYIHAPTPEQVLDLLQAGKGVIKMITLAPEVCSKEIIELILSHGIRISAGHSNATYEEAMHGFRLGIQTVTHLYNAMSPLQHRAPGLVGAVMDHATAMASIIPDGYHVDYAAIRIAKQVLQERLFVITDAVTETNTGDYQHVLKGDKYEAAGILSGSALTMSKAVQQLIHFVNVDAGEAIRMCSLYPARLLGMDTQCGKISKGFNMPLLVLDEQYNAVQLLE